MLTHTPDDTAKDFFMLLKGSVYVIIKKIRQKNVTSIINDRLAQLSKGLQPLSIGLISGASPRSKGRSPMSKLRSPTTKITSPNTAARSHQKAATTLTLKPQLSFNHYVASPSSKTEDISDSCKERDVVSSVYGENELIRNFPLHEIINTLRAPNYFGEIALNDATLRYVYMCLYKS